MLLNRKSQTGPMPCTMNTRWSTWGISPSEKNSKTHMCTHNTATYLNFAGGAKVQIKSRDMHILPLIYIPQSFFFYILRQSLDKLARWDSNLWSNLNPGFIDLHHHNWVICFTEKFLNLFYYCKLAKKIHDPPKQGSFSILYQIRTICPSRPITVN